MKTGYVACDYTTGDMLSEVRHGEIKSTDDAARKEMQSGDYEGVRYVHADGYLYVDSPDAN